MRNESALPIPSPLEATAPLAIVAATEGERRMHLALLLQLGGFDVVKVRDATEALDRIGDYLMGSAPRYFDLVVVDMSRRERSGLDLFLRLRHGRWRPPVVLIVPGGNEALRAEAEGHGAFAVLEWPLSAETLQRTAVAARRFAGSSAGRHPI